MIEDNVINDRMLRTIYFWLNYLKFIDQGQLLFVTGAEQKIDINMKVNVNIEFSEICIDFQ